MLKEKIKMTKSRMNINETAKKFMSSNDNDEKKEEKPLTKEVDNKKEKTKKSRPFIKDGGYTQRAYYITDEQYTDIKLLAVYRDTDTSSIVREALKEYIKNNKNELKR
jgi:hypothetical protein